MSQGAPTQRAPVACDTGVRSIWYTLEVLILLGCPGATSRKKAVVGHG